MDSVIKPELAADGQPVRRRVLSHPRVAFSTKADVPVLGGCYRFPVRVLRQRRNHDFYPHAKPATEQNAQLNFTIDHFHQNQGPNSDSNDDPPEQRVFAGGVHRRGNMNLLIYDPLPIAASSPRKARVH